MLCYIKSTSDIAMERCKTFSVYSSDLIKNVAGLVAGRNRGHGAFFPPGAAFTRQAN